MTLPRIARRLLPLLTLLAGCTPSLSGPPFVHLIDRRDLAGYSAPKPSPATNLPPLPLAVVRFDSVQVDFRPQLDAAIDAALARKPDVEFNVVSPLTHASAPDSTIEAHATEVAREIAERSVDPARIHLGVSEVPGQPAQEIRVYVR